jgi:signal transduction histidine kinase
MKRDIPQMDGEPAPRCHWLAVASQRFSGRVPRFLADYRYPKDQAPRIERILAVGRSFFTISALIAIYLDPTEPTRFAQLTYGLLSSYAFYSIAVLVMVRRTALVGPRLALGLHGVDILWVSALTFFSEGPVSPFFLFFLFVSLSAAYRWGSRETMATAAITVAVLLIETVIAATGPWKRTWFAEFKFSLNPIIIQTTYLLLTGFLLGYLADQEKQFRAEMAAITDAIQQPGLERGLGGSVAALARLVQRMFGASAVDIVIQDHDRARTMLWHAGGAGQVAGHESVRRFELDDMHRRAWLFDAPPHAWFSVGPVDQSVTALTLDGARWKLEARTLTLPPLFTDDRQFSGLAGVDFGLGGEWQGRLLLFDPTHAGSVDTRVEFLASLAEHITPVLSNVFLLRRLRSRAGAAERARVARELHDGAIQALIGIEMKMETLRRRVDADTAVASDVADIQRLMREEVTALRELMQELRPVELDAPHLLPDLLAQLVERFGRETGVSAKFVSSANTMPMPLRLAVEVVRIVQEGLVNVRKHSRAGHVIVRLCDHGPGWMLTIEDDGCGFGFDGRLTQPELDSRWLGPTIIKERARAIGGHVAVQSTPGSGACVEVTFHATNQ